MTNEAPLRLGRCICVVGTSGAGKSYLAEALARTLGLRYVCNNALIWGPDWYVVPPNMRVAVFDEATREPGWVCDGNLGSSPEDDLLRERCDTIVWLDLPRREVHWQIVRRTIRRAWTSEPLWHGNVERWRAVFSRDSMIWWSVKTFARRRRAYGAMFGDPRYADRVLVRLGSRSEVNQWLHAVAAVQGR